MNYPPIGRRGFSSKRVPPGLWGLLLSAGILCLWIFVIERRPGAGALPPGALDWLELSPRWGSFLLAALFPLLLVRHRLDLKKNENRLRDLIRGISTAPGDVFWQSLRRHLSDALGMDIVLAGRFTGNAPAGRLHLSVTVQSQKTSTYQYPLADSPFAALAEGQVCAFPRMVQRLFPKDPLLSDLDIESLVGMVLFDSEGAPLGLMAVAGQTPIKDLEYAKALLRAFAVRGTAEMERQRSEEKSREQSELLQTILSAIPAPIFYKNEKGVYLGCNQAFERFIGLPKENVIGQTVYGVAPKELADVYREADAKLLAQGGTQKYEASVRYADGSQHEVLFHKAVFHKSDGSPGGMVGAMLDITELREAEKKIRYLAEFDPLTNLPNQVLFADRMNLAIAHSHRLGRKFAIFSLDLDHFKKINNTFGLPQGDELLRKVALRLKNRLHEDDTVSRMGGDSYLLLLPDIREEEDAAKIAAGTLEAFREPFDLNGQEVFITASIGIALFPMDGTRGETLLKNAGNALSRAKELGRNNYRFYAPAMNARSKERITLENALRRALKRQELVLHYQPQLETASGKVVGAEALLRWHHPELGWLAPNDFIPLAEETGLIVPIGEWVLRTACSQARAWQDKGLAALRMAVNLSPRQFKQPDLFRKIEGILKETGLAPDCLSLEITESVVMSDVDHTIETLSRLKKLGVHLSIDDFGTGYSSLSYLKRFPIDMLKIDRSFIMDIPTLADDMAIVTAVIAMAHSLNIQVLAEGVETEQQREFLIATRCDEQQGFYFSRPLPAVEFLRQLGSGDLGAVREEAPLSVTS